MNAIWGHTLEVFLGFFAIMNPIANTTVFVSLSGDLNKAQKKQVAFKSLMTTLLIITAFCILGKGIFVVFGITLPALKMAGGILVFLIGFKMIQGSDTKASEPGTHENCDTDIAIYPLAVPMLAGPGTIATAMNYAAVGGISKVLITIFAFAILCLITYVCFISGDKIVKWLGKSGIDIVTRLMGLILAVIGMQMFLVGVFEAQKFFNPS